LGNQFKIHFVLCDSGFYRIEFIEYLENKGYRYILSVPIQPPIQQQLVSLCSWTRIEDGLEVGEFSFEHKDEKWTHPRRYVAVRQHITTRPEATGKSGNQMVMFEEYEQLGHYRYSVFITNEKELSPANVWRQYRPRANDENIIKDLKEGLGFEMFNLNSFWATEAALVATALVCYNLLHWFDTQLLDRNAGKHQVKTIRHTWFILPGLLGNSAGIYRLRIAVKDKSIRAKIVRILNEIHLLQHQLYCNALEPP